MFQIQKITEGVCGSFHIEKENMKNGVIQKYQEQHNLITDTFSKAMGVTTNGYSHFEVFGALLIGDGNQEPSASDTKLGHQLWSIGPSSGVASVSEDLRQISITVRYILGASSSYVGTIREVGLNGEFGMVTHSLLKDAEGNAYEIQKTDLDQLTFVYTVTITISDMDQVWLDPLRRVRSGYTGSTHIVDFSCLAYYENYYERGFAALTPIKTMLWKGSLVSRYNRSLSCSYRDKPSTSYPFAYPTTYHSADASYNAADKTAVIPRRRFLKDGWLNDHFINVICPFGNSGNAGTLQLLMPNETLLGKATLSNYSVGTGDGETTDFIPPIPMWIKDTEEIFVNEVKQVRGVDYTVDPFHNLSHRFELEPSSHMMQIEGPTAGATWINYSADMGVSSMTKASHSRTYDPKNLGTADGTQLFLNQNGDSIFYMFGEEDLKIDQTVTDAYFAVYSRYSNEYYTNNNTISLAYSNDGENYTEVLADIHPDAKSMAGENLANLTRHEIQSVKATYWKLTIHNLNSSYKIGELGFVLTHHGKPLQFKTPPVAGASITMSCDIDRPWKDDKHVLDITGTVQL